MGTKKLVSLQDSELPVLRSIKMLGAYTPNQAVNIEFHLRHSNPLPDQETLHFAPPHPDEHLSFESFSERHSAAKEDIQAVSDFVSEHGLTLGDVHETACMIEASGSVDAIEAAFGVQLKRYQGSEREFFGHDGPIQIPADLSDIVRCITGLDDRSTLVRVRPQELTFEDMPDTVPEGFDPFFPTEIAKHYNFPEHLDGSGETIAIFSMGGQFDPSDMDRYFSEQGLSVPEIEVVQIGNPPAPGASPLIEDLELTLDVQVAGSIAPGAKIVVYRIDPNIGQPYLTAMKRAIWDPTRKPSVVSISYGAAELRYRKADMEILNETFAAATQTGVTICVASGDGGSGTRDYDHFQFPPEPHVNFPANCPFVLSCGGTTLQVNDNQITDESVWNSLNQCRAASAGGVSRVFQQPGYQQAASVPENAAIGVDFRGRGIPDVAANACERTGYKILFRGKWLPVGGTSASTPLWAGLIARLNQGLGHRCGHLNPLLYRMAGTPVFENIRAGFNGAYKATHGWDACTGLGRPDGTALFNALKELSATPTSALNLVKPTPLAPPTGIAESQASYVTKAMQTIRQIYNP